MPARTTCPLRLMVQLSPLDSSLTADALRLAENELRHPTGLPTEVIRVHVAGGVWSSWECGVAGLIEGKGEILRAESFWRGSVDCRFLLNCLLERDRQQKLTGSLLCLAFRRVRFAAQPGASRFSVTGVTGCLPR